MVSPIGIHVLYVLYMYCIYYVYCVYCMYVRTYVLSVLCTVYVLCVLWVYCMYCTSIIHIRMQRSYTHPSLSSSYCTVGAFQRTSSIWSDVRPPLVWSAGRLRLWKAFAGELLPQPSEGMLLLLQVGVAREMFHAYIVGDCHYPCFSPATTPAVSSSNEITYYQ